MSRTLLAGPGALLRLAGAAVCTGGEPLFRGGIVARAGSGDGPAAEVAVVSPLMPGLAVCTGAAVPLRGGIVARTGSGGGAAAADAVASPLIPGWAASTGVAVPLGGMVALVGCMAAAASPAAAGLAVCTGCAFAGFTDAASVAGWVVGAAVAMPTVVSLVAVCAPVPVGGGVAFAVGVGVACTQSDSVAVASQLHAGCPTLHTMRGTREAGSFDGMRVWIRPGMPSRLRKAARAMEKCTHPPNTCAATWHWAGPAVSGHTHRARGLFLPRWGRRGSRRSLCMGHMNSSGATPEPASMQCVADFPAHANE